MGLNVCNGRRALRVGFTQFHQICEYVRAAGGLGLHSRLFGAAILALGRGGFGCVFAGQHRQDTDEKNRDFKAFHAAILTESPVDGKTPQADFVRSFLSSEYSLIRSDSLSMRGSASRLVQSRGFKMGPTARSTR